MGLTRLAIRRPLTVLMIILMVVLLGVRAFTMLQVDRYPKMDMPVVTVVTVLPGGSPEDIQDLVTKPIEDAVATVNGIDLLTSSSSDGVSFVVATLLEGTNATQAAADIQRQVASARSSLPSEAQEPMIIKADINATAVMRLVLTGPQGQDALAQIAKDDIKPVLQSVSGVATVNISGGRQRQMQVNLDPDKLAAYGLPVSAVQQLVAANDLTFPAGSLDEGRQRQSVRALGKFSSLSELQDLPIASNALVGVSSSAGLPGQNIGGTVRLRDVATVQAGYEDQARILRLNGQDGVGISIVKTGDANTIQVADGVREAIKALQGQLPAGAEIKVIVDDSQYTRASIDGVQKDLILGVLIAGLVMLAFLHTIRSTFIVVLAIPTSIISTFLVMWVLGFSLNNLTLIALTLVIGILLDDSIVVLENSERHLKMGKSPRQAALDGRSEIGMAAITITLVDVVTYVPVAFSSGIVGSMFRSYGLTIVAATLFSLVVSFTLTPMLAARWLKGEEAAGPSARRSGFWAALARPWAWLWNGFARGWEAAFDRLARGYGRLLGWALKNRLTQGLVGLIAVVALAGGLYLVASGVIGSELLGSEDDGQVLIDISMPAGTNLLATDEAARQAEAIIRAQVPEAATILTEVGSASSSLLGTTETRNQANMIVRLVDKSARQRTIEQVMEPLRREMAKIPDAKVTIQGNSAITSLAGSMGGIQVELTGPDATQLAALASQAEQVIRQVPGTGEVINSAAETSSEARLAVDRERVADLGLTTAQVASTLRTALTGTEVGKYKEEGQAEIPVVLRMDASARSNVTRLTQIPVGYGNGRRITLGQAVRVETGQAPATLARSHRRSTVYLNTTAVGRPDGDVTNDIETALRAKVSFPAGYGFAFQGVASEQRKAFSALFAAIAMSILLIYMLMVALYQNWLHPLAIMFSLPVSLVGAFGGLWLTGGTLNIISLLGVILLIGVVTKNAILIVDFTDKLREEGYSRKDALIQAGRLRLRPILMTTFALVFALLPLLLSSGAGSEARSPIAVVVIGGNITSTLLSLVLVPVVYNVLDGLAERFSRKHKSQDTAQTDRLELEPGGNA